MNHKTRKITTLAAVALGIVLVCYAGTLMSDIHAWRAPASDRVVDLGTIVVTPRDTPERAARDARRYAMHTRPSGLQTHDSVRRAI